MSRKGKKVSRRERIKREIRIEIDSLRRLLAIAAGWLGATRLMGGLLGNFSDPVWYLGNSNAFEGYQGERRIGED